MADDLMAFNLSDDEGSGQEATGTGPTAQQHGEDLQAGGCCDPPSRRDKLNQTEEAFQRLKAEYKVKVENGEIWKTLELDRRPPGDDTAIVVVTKQEAQELLHAVEELYFFRRYAEGARLVARMLDDDVGLKAGLDADTKATLALYREKCLQRAGATAIAPAVTAG